MSAITQVRSKRIGSLMTEACLDLIVRQETTQKRTTQCVLKEGAGDKRRKYNAPSTDARWNTTTNRTTALESKSETNDVSGGSDELRVTLLTGSAPDLL